jgi:hypothetical protein
MARLAGTTGHNLHVVHPNAIGKAKEPGIRHNL